MKRKTREAVAFVLNFLLPGLGFYFSGATHGRRWLRLLGIGLAALFVTHLVQSSSFSLYTHLDYLESSLRLVLVFIFGTLGAGVEQEIDRSGHEVRGFIIRQIDRSHSRGCFSAAARRGGEPD